MNLVVIYAIQIILSTHAASSPKCLGTQTLRNRKTFRTSVRDSKYLRNAEASWSV